MEAVIQLHGDRYSLYEQLGNGSFGEVWRGRDHHQETEIAVKLLAEEVTLDEVLLEAQLLARFREHPRIVTIRNVELSPPRPFIVMDFMPGGSVQDRLKRGKVSLVEAVRWVRQALDGLGHAHSIGVLHRDIKPGNVLLDAQDRTVLSDFGIAEDTVQNLLANEAIYVAHAAPELRDSGSSIATDVWAMGCTLYRLLTGDYPFEDNEDARSRPVGDPHRLNPQVPFPLTRVVRRALATDPAHRYQNTREMLSELTRCRIVNAWRCVEESAEAERWEAEAQEGSYELGVRTRRDGRREILVRLDRSRGPRRLFREVVSRESDARRIRRNLLVAVVEGRRPA